MLGKLFGIGVGPGDPELLTLKAINVLKQSDCVFVPESGTATSTALQIALPHLKEGAEVKTMHFPMIKNLDARIEMRKANAAIIAEELEKGNNCVFLTLGDPMLYSTYSYLLEYIPKDAQVESVPGIYSFAAISNLKNIPLTKGNERLSVICSFSEEDIEVIKSFDTVVCMKVSAYREKLYHALKSLPTDSYSFMMVSEVGKENEYSSKSIEELQKELPYFTTAILKKS